MNPDSLPLVLVDEKIPFLRGVMEPYARVVYRPGNSIGKVDVRKADAMVIRTRTRCSRDLLSGSSVKYIATATIGFDHIDTEYCEDAGIEWKNAPGCNASSVMQYVASCLAMIHLVKGDDIRGKVLGIIGVGHVGSKVNHLAGLLGMETLLYDPPREQKEGGEAFCRIEDIFRRAEIVSFHVPLQYSGIYKTFHMGNVSFFSRFHRPVYLINTSRGEVLQTETVLEAMKKGTVREAFIDVWENEPYANPELVKRSFISTPHIAGYSVEGKANGTSVAVRFLSEKFGWPLDNWYPGNLPVPDVGTLFPSGKTPSEYISNTLLKAYPVKNDSLKFKLNPRLFEQQRNQYPVRREYGAYRIMAGEIPVGVIPVMNSLGINIDYTND